MEIDEVRACIDLSLQLEELEKEISKLQTSMTNSEKTTQVRLRNSLKDLQTEHQQLKVYITFLTVAIENPEGSN